MTFQAKVPTLAVGRLSALAFAWTATLAASELPLILLRELTGSAPAWLVYAKLAFLAGAIVIGVAWRAVRPLLPYFILLIGVNALPLLIGDLWIQTQLSRAVTSGQDAFVDRLAVQQSQRVAIGLLMAGLAWLLLRRRSAFFFQLGDPAAPAAPVQWVGLMGTGTWKRRGPAIAIALSAGVVVFSVLAGGAPLANLGRALPLLPFILLFAAANAVGEEMIYRAPELGALQPVVGGVQALLMTAAFFGIGHFYGVPYGLLGVAMSTVAGWFLGRSMLETKGFFWAWFIHFLMDVCIFTFLAAGSVAAGGR